ncbi:hypothetical protein CARUB_v10002386mg [Capsella rubella]|uniref:Uncharacterized protein n=1 Tax=Capsella rubella TaxID=81985 RepID=R0HA81_9BRAS|nr:uncharacterized protein LOC17881940 [Capsella rubella]EOA21905.1 hypothetical protein CARUB_v10002386mg [Capsella rubella]
MYGVGGSSTAGFAEAYAMRKIYKEKMKMKLAETKAEEDNKDNNVEEKKSKILKTKKSKKTLQTNPRVSSADF